MILSARNIFKSYGNLAVLKAVDIDIDKGEFITIIGKSGAGKSTLLHILGTLDNADKGSLEILGMDISKLKHQKLSGFRNQNIGFVFQFHHLLPEFTALENVAIPALIGGDTDTNAKKKAKDLLDYLGLGQRLKHKPNELSGGEQQRVAIARALINNPALIMADEPTGNLDSVTSSDIHALIATLRKELQITFIIVTHNQELAALSDRSIHMTDGNLDIDS